MLESVLLAPSMESSWHHIFGWSEMIYFCLNLSASQIVYGSSCWGGNCSQTSVGQLIVISWIYSYAIGAIGIGAFSNCPVFFHPFTTRMLRSEIVGSGGRQTEKNVCKKGVHKPPLLRCHSRKSIGWYYMKYKWRCHEMFGNIMKYEKSMDISQFTPTLGLNKKDDRMAGSSWTRVLVFLLTLPNTNH